MAVAARWGYTDTNLQQSTAPDELRRHVEQPLPERDFSYSQNTRLGPPAHGADGTLENAHGDQQPRRSRSPGPPKRGEGGGWSERAGPDPVPGPSPRTQSPAQPPARPSLPVAICYAQENGHARGRAHPAHVWAERDAKGDGAGHQRVSFQLPRDNRR